VIPELREFVDDIGAKNAFLRIFEGAERLAKAEILSLYREHSPKENGPARRMERTRCYATLRACALLQIVDKNTALVATHSIGFRASQRGQN
jgi:hypothetical protein